MNDKVKILIIEGCDRSGKDTLINELKNDYGKVLVLHSGIPSNDDTKDLYSYYYDNLIHSTLDAYYNTDNDLVIHNRSIYGEYVYGTKYRSEDKESVLKAISNLEAGQLNTFIKKDQLYFVLLSNTDPSVLAKNDDGNSYSSKVNDIQDELNLFKEVFDRSKIKNKRIVYINDGSMFRSKLDIYNEVNSFINNK
jgi:thymidylate kinase